MWTASRHRRTPLSWFRRVHPRPRFARTAPQAADAQCAAARPSLAGSAQAEGGTAMRMRKTLPIMAVACCALLRAPLAEAQLGPSQLDPIGTPAFSNPSSTPAETDGSAIGPPVNSPIGAVTAPNGTIGPTPLNPAGPTPLNPAGPTPLNPVAPPAPMAAPPRPSHL